MSLTHYAGMHGGNAETDNTVETGTVARSSEVPSDSQSTQSLALTAGDKVRFQWLRGDTQTALSGDHWHHWRMSLAAVNLDSDKAVIGIARDGAEAIAVSFGAGTGLPTIRIGGSVVATAASGAISAATWERYLLHIGGRAENDVISLHPNGDSSATPIVQHTITAGEAATLAGIGVPNESFAEAVSGACDYKFTDVGTMDPNDATDEVDPAIFTDFTVKLILLTGDLSPFAWVGSYTDIDERPFSDADHLQALAANAQAALAKEALSGLTDNLYGVRINVSAEEFGSGGAGTLIGVDLAVEEQFTVPATRDTFSLYYGGITPADFDTNLLSVYSRP